MNPRRPHFNPLRHQRGAIAIMTAALFIPLFLFLVVVLDTGRLFYQKRSMQTDADLAALETAVLYCRDQTMDAAGRLAVATDVLSVTRNNFAGSGSDIQVTLGRIDLVDDGSGGTVKQFTADDTGHAIQVVLTHTVPASLFSQISPSGSDTVTFQATAVAESCQPLAGLAIRSSILTVDSTQSTLLNGILGGLLGSSINLTVAQWDALLNTNINLLSYLDAAAVSLGVTAGDYNSVLGSNIALADALDIGVDILTAQGDAIAATALQDLANAVPGGAQDIQLGDLIAVPAGSPDSAYNFNLQSIQLASGTVQTSSANSALEVDLPISVLGLTGGSTLKIKVIEPPQLSSIGNAEQAKQNPTGANAIYVRTAQVRTFISLDLPIVGSTLTTLEGLLDNALVSAITGIANDALSLNLISLIDDLTCLLSCNEEKDIIDIEVLSSPRIDIAIDAGSADARVTDYSCNSDGSKSLTVPAQTSTLAINVGQFGSSAADAATNAFSSGSLSVDPIPILDIGTKHVRRSCILAICSTEYQQGAGWTSDPNAADRTAFSGGGIGLRASDSVLAGSQTLNFADSPDETYLPEIDQPLTDNAYQTIDSSSLVTSAEDTILGIDLEFYDAADDSSLGLLTNLIGATADTLGNTVSSLLDTTLSPVVSALVSDLLEPLGINLNNSEIGASLTCESDKVELSM